MQSVDFRSESHFEGFRKLYILNRTNNSILVKMKETKSGELCIFKYFMPPIIPLDNIEKEYNIQSSISHPNILRILGRFRANKYIAFQMPFLPGGTLTEAIQKKRIIYPKSLAIIFRKLLEVLKYLHKRRILHGDISPNNIMFETTDFTEPNPILIDFGCSQVVHMDNLVCEYAGTKGFVAPEVEKRIPHGLPSDIWALGALILYIVNHNQDLSSPMLSSLISSMLVPNPSQRPSASKCLEHEYFNIGE